MTCLVFCNTKEMHDSKKLKFQIKKKQPFHKSNTYIDKNHPFSSDFIEKSYMTRHKYYFISKCVISGCLLYFVTWHLISIIKFVFILLSNVYLLNRKELALLYINIKAWHIFVLFNMFIIFFYCLVVLLNIFHAFK